MDDVVRLSRAARQVWAKGWYQRGVPDDGGTGTRAWLPLWQHLHDAAGVAGQLWDSWLPQVVKTRIGDAAGGDAAGRVLVSLLAGVHDVGKASPAFAVQVDVLRDEMVRAGLPMAKALPGRGRLPHGLAGQVILERWLETEHRWSLAEARSLSSVVGAHHGIPPSVSEAKDARIPTTTNTELLGGEPWGKVQGEIVAHMVGRTGAAPHLAGTRWRKLPQPVLALALALVVVADWLASNEDLFPLVPVGDTRPLAQPDGDDERRLAQAWEGVHLPRPWKPEQVEATADQLLRDRFDLPGDAAARPVQRAAVTAARAMDPAGILVIEAPMGEGKTEAAMLAAEVLAARSGAGGVMVALPTQATSDAMFGRVMHWIAGQRCTHDGEDVVGGEGTRAGGPGERRAVFLAHGKAWLNPDFAAVPRAPLPVRDVGRDESRARGSDPTAAGGAYVDG